MKFSKYAKSNRSLPSPPQSLDFESKGVKFTITGIHERNKKWFVDVKNIATGKRAEVTYDSISHLINR